MNISLLGMMGSGKTTIGKLLSQSLNMPFVDTDSFIVQRENRSINEIFADSGENYFRKLEQEVLFEVLQSDNQVISTGGGIVKLHNNVELLKEKSLSFYLQADSETLYQRVKNNTDRPLLNDVNMKDKISFLLSERSSLYEKSDFIVNTVDKTPDVIVKEIINKLS